MSTRSRKPATESLEEAREMKLLQSIIDQESETTDDAKRPNNQNSFDANRRFVDRHSHDKSNNEKILPAAKTSGDLRLARSLTNGRKPSSSNSSRLSVGGISLRSASSGLNRQLVPPPLQSPYESGHKQRMVTKYREIGRILYEAMQPQTPSVSLPRQGWVLPVESHQTPKYSVKRNPLLGRSYAERSLSAYGRMAEDKGYLQSKKEKGEEAIEIVSEGSRTETPSVEIVSVVDDMDGPFSGNSSVKRVTFNPEATISEPNAGSFARRTTDGSKWNDKSNSQRQEIDQLRRAKTDTSLLRVHKSKRNKENELRSKENDEEQKRYSFNEKRNSSLDSQRRIRSLSRTGNRLSPQRRFDSSFDATDSTVSGSVSMRRSRSPRASRRLLASWSYTPYSDSLDQHILLTDHHLKSTSNIEIRRWLEQKNRLLRKQRREERKLERMVQREESEKQREKNEHQLEYQEKARQWMKERKRENLLKKRLSKQLRASTSDSYDFRQRSADRETGRSLNKRKNGASRAKSAPVEMRERSRGKSAVREERAKNKERQKKTAYQEWLKVDRENPKSSVIEMHTENATNDHIAEGRKARGRSKSAGKSLSKSVQLDSADSENLHNKNSKVRISTQSSKDRLDPQGSDFKETSSSRGDAEREEDIRYNINSTKGDENSNDDIDRQTLDEENENEKDYENDYESELKEGASDNRSLTNERHHKDESHSGVDGEVDQKEESRARSRSYRSHSRTSSNSEHDEEASKNRNLTNKKKKESDSEVDGESDQKENSRVRSRSPGSDRQESRAERNESRSLSVREDGDKKKDLYDIDDRNDDSQSHRKRNSVDSTTSREYRDQTQTPPRNSSPKRRSEEQNSGSESDASETSGFVRKNKRKEMATQPSEDTEKQRIGSSRHSSKSREYENNPATPEASEENFRNRKSYSKEHSDKFARSSDHDTELQRIASRNSFNSNQNEERDNPVLRSSSRAKQTGDWTDYGETRAREETSPRNSKPPSGIFSSHSKNREVDADDRSQHDDDMDMLRRHSIVEDQPGEENRLGDTYSLGHHATEENLGNLTFRKSADNENDEFSPFKAETRDLDSRNSAHIKNDEDLSFFKAETRDIASRNSINSKKYDELSTFKGETSKMASRNSAQSKNDEDDHIPFKTRDLASRNSAQSKNDDDHISFKAESRNVASRNSAQSKNDEDHISFKAESRNVASRNSIQSKNDDDHIPFKPMDLASRNSGQSKNDDNHIPFKAESRNMASRNSIQSKNDDDHISFKPMYQASRNSAQSKNEDDHIPFKAESRNMASRNSTQSKNDDDHISFKPMYQASRNSAQSKNDEDHIPFKSETRNLASRNSAQSKNDEDHIPFKSETRNLASRNSVQSKNDDDHIPFKSETRNLASRNSVQSKNDDDHIPFKSESRNLASRNSIQSKNDDDHIPFKAESRNLASRNSIQSKNDDDHIPFKAESRNLASRNSIQSKNDDDHISFKPMYQPSRNSAQSKNDDDHISFKPMYQPSRNSAQSKNDDDHISFKPMDLASRNSAQSKNDDDHISFKPMDLASRNSAQSKNDEDHIPFKAESRNLASRNSAQSKNDEDHIPSKTRDLASRNSAQSRNDEDHISYKAETRDLASSNSDHNKKYDELSTFKGETSKMVSRNSAHSKNDDELSLLKGETRDMASRNSGYSQNDEYLSHFKPETKDNFKEFKNNKSEY